jgi:hypothetical protein
MLLLCLEEAKITQKGINIWGMNDVAQVIIAIKKKNDLIPMHPNFFSDILRDICSMYVWIHDNWIDTFHSGHRDHRC